ncbi:hypothetical protein BDB00DRAFT_752180, partial [Zychaea mexicana]|uniref:uncharacterized protein n=1 Tax=Zychaea mexicana TaxID=64656 RepID=UPI0022FDF115
MFFETTYVPSPQLSATSTIEEGSNAFSFRLPKCDSSCDEASSESPVDHLIFVIHAKQYGHFYEHSKFI